MRIENAPYVKAVMGGNEYAIQNSPKNVAAAIYKANVTQQNISILTPDNVTIVSTFGPFLDRCTDLDYTNKKAYTRIDGNADASAASAAGEALPQ